MGYNGLKTKFDLPKAIWEDRDARLPYIIHAEQNLLSLVKRGEVKTLAVTLAPCSHCAKSIVAHNINRVIYLNEYERDPSGLNILRQYGVELIYIPQEQVKTALLDFWSQTL
jgi:dCMP deaminase